MAMTSDIQNSIAARGVISTSVLVIGTLYGATKSLEAATDACRIVSRVAGCIKSVFSSATAMPGWQEFGAQMQDHLYQIYQPTKNGKWGTDKKDNEKNLTELAWSGAKSALIGALVFDARFILAGAIPGSYSAVLSYMGPFKLDSDWKGPLALAMEHFFPAVVTKIQQFQFHI